MDDSVLISFQNNRFINKINSFLVYNRIKFEISEGWFTENFINNSIIAIIEGWFYNSIIEFN